MSAILIGCDPEVFLKDSAGGFVSAHGLIPGTKEDPHVIPMGAVQVDGMACEFNTDPASTRQEFIDNVQGVFKSLSEMLPDNLSLAPGVPVARFTPEVFKAQPLEALELGCEPDYNAYTGEANPRPDAHGKPIRTAAGHIHIGFQSAEDPFDFLHMQDCCELVKMLDVFVGLDSLEFDDDTERRSLYGKAGAFRPKPYGVEYRTLSNAWIRSSDLIGRVYDTSTTTTEIYQMGARIEDDIAAMAREYIDTSNTEAASELLAQMRSRFGL